MTTVQCRGAIMRNWPISGVSARTDRVELRWPTLDDLDDLADRGAGGVHAPEFMPFFSQWTDGDRETVAARVLQRHWRALAEWTPQDWTLYLAIVHDGRVVGSQSIGARDFAATREGLVTSWLSSDSQGLGLGAHARAALLELAFTGLDAEHVLSVVRRGNAASEAVCAKFGFRHDGVQVNSVRGEQVVSSRFRLDRARWEEFRHHDVALCGVEAALPMFGVGGVRVEGSAAARAGMPLAQTLSGVALTPESDQWVE